MPELPDVEGFRQYFDNTALNKNIKEVEVESASMLEGISSKALISKLTGKKFSSSERHGKYFFGRVSKTQYLILHFGMTGYFQYTEEDEELKKNARLIIRFTKYRSLAFVCPRKFGKISFTDDLDNFLKSKNLGLDPIKSKINFSKFEEITEGKSAKIKTILMDQSILAGIGNVYADEILYHTGIHPEVSIDDIEKDDKKKLVSNIGKILKTGIKVNTGSKEFPENYLLKRRSSGKSCGLCSGKIRKITVGGRSTYYCDKHQKK